MTSDKSTYFAARGNKEIGGAIFDKIKRQWDLSGASIASEWQNAYANLYSDNFTGLGVTSSLMRAGSQGELAQIRINEARSVKDAYVALVTAPQLTWQPKAKNSDSSAARATSLASMILEQEWGSKGVAEKWVTLVDQSVCFGEAFIFQPWDRGAGKLVGEKEHPFEPNRKVPVFEGDVSYSNVLPWDVYRDMSATSYDSMRWRVVCTYENKWDVAMLYPRTIEGEPSLDLICSAAELNGPARAWAQPGDSDRVAVFHFIHAPTPSLPWGRYVLMTSDQCVLMAKPLCGVNGDYDAAPLVRLANLDVHGTPLGWSRFWDTLSTQEVTDGLHSGVITNQLALLVQCIGLMKGAEFEASDFVQGMRVIRTPPGVPANQAAAPIQLTQSPEEVFKYLDTLSAIKPQLMGMNEVSMGQSPGAQMNAQAFAVLASAASQQAAPFQKRATKAAAAMGTSLLTTLRKHVKAPRMVRQAGKAMSLLVKSLKYSGEDLGALEDVDVEIGDALTQTTQGRLTILEQLMAVPGAITSAQQVTEVLATGRIEVALRASRDEQFLVMWEYEQLMQGVNPPVHYAQDHLLHYRQNNAVRSNPAALEDVSVLQAVDQHLAAHYAEYYALPVGMDPKSDPLYSMRVRQLLGQEPPLMPMPMDPNATPPPGPGATSGTPPPMAAGADASAPMGAMAEMNAPEAPPDMPINPATGEQLPGPPVPLS